MKELRDYLKLFRNYSPLTFGFILISVLGSLSWQWGREVTYQTSATIYVSKNSEPKNNQYYTYEGYYALLSAKESTDVLVGVLKSSDLQSVAYTKVPDLKVIETQVKKSSQQLIEVKISASTEEGAKKALTSLLEVGSSRAKLTSDQGFGVGLVNPDIIASRVEPNLALALAIALVGGLVLSLLVIVTREYFLA